MIGKIVLLIGMIYGSITDIKRREVPNTVNYLLIAIGLILGLSGSLLHNNWIFFLQSLAGLAVGALIGLALFYVGQWGGGDAKMLMGVGAILGYFFNTEIFSQPLLIFVIGTFIIGAVYGLIWMIALALKNKNKMIKEYKKNVLDKKNLYTGFLLLILNIILVIALYLFVPINTSSLILVATILILGSLFILFLSEFVKAVEKEALIKKIAVSKLVEGDWILTTTYKGQKLDINSNGITQKQINKLKSLGVKKVTVREGIPFIPSFLITYIILLFI